ncbi:hypothetical protein MVES_000002 [Malassezia vespertilionis]|uniref:Uncharacterized protein n=1 Tax=Malassezia vespertilionis TaxID=2020962 RepID=A0A2N1JGE1_9BASI|nr:hypothetical protein MVES_000002 [Malassezia vespertilionis]
MQREIPMRRFVPPSAKTPSLPPFNIPRHEDSDSDAQSTTTSSILDRSCAHALWRISEHTEPRATPHDNTSPLSNAHGHAGPNEKEHAKRASVQPHTSTDLDRLHSLPQAQQTMDEDCLHWMPWADTAVPSAVTAL